MVEAVVARAGGEGAMGLVGTVAAAVVGAAADIRRERAVLETSTISISSKAQVWRSCCRWCPSTASVNHSDIINVRRVETRPTVPKKKRRWCEGLVLGDTSRMK
jgi:hypothetical protein